MQSKIEIYNRDGTTTLVARTHSLATGSASQNKVGHYLDALTAAIGGVMALCVAGGWNAGSLLSVFAFLLVVVRRMQQAAQIAEEHVQLINGVGMQLIQVSRDGRVRSRCVVELDEIRDVFIHEGLYLCRVVVFLAVSLRGGEQTPSRNITPTHQTDKAARNVLLFRSIRLSLGNLQCAYSRVYDWLDREGSTKIQLQSFE
jgi:hypothetical protein